MQRILVDEKRWIGQRRFLHALNYCMLLPGPEAQQLATYVGWLLHGWRGGLVAGTLFVLPGFAAILGLSVLYVLYRDLPAMEGIFLGLKAAVLAIVVEALVRIGRRALREPLLQAVATASFVAIFFLGVPFPLLVIGAAGIGATLGPRFLPDPGADEEQAAGDRAALGARPSAGRLARVTLVGLAAWSVPFLVVGLFLGTDHVLFDEATFFSQVAVVTFGGAYAVLAYVAQQAVETFAWLLPGEMLDGLGMAETTPGPLIQVVQFVGFMGAFRDPAPFGPLGAAVIGSIVTSWVTFAPCFLWIFTAAPYVEYLRGRPALAAALTAITAAVVGVILNLSLWFAVHTLFGETRELTGGGLRMDVPVLASLDPAAAAIAVLSFVMLFGLRRGMLTTIGVAALLGAGWRLLG